LLTTSDLNHYEDDATTRVKDRKAIERLLALDARGLYDTCRNEKISMCGLGPAVAMITALQYSELRRAELVQYATSADVSGDTRAGRGVCGDDFQLACSLRFGICMTVPEFDSLGKLGRGNAAPVRRIVQE